MIMRTITVWAVMLFVTVGIVGGRLGYIMLIDSEFYQQKAAEQQLYDTELRAERGKIYDRNGELLATSAQVWTVYITPNSFKKVTDEAKRTAIKQEIATNLSTILDLDYQKVLGYTNKQTSYVKVKSNVEKPQADKIREFIANSTNNIGNYIGLDESSKRYYPNDSLASVVLGYVGSDNQGLAGLELQYDDELTGIPGRVVAAKDATGNDMPLSYEVEVAAQPGNSLITTIDSYVQYVCEKYLDQALIDNKVTERGAIICMNVNTGAVMGMAVKGDFNPNSYLTLSEEDQSIVDSLTNDEEKNDKIAQLRNKQWRNKVVSDTYEPGSVFKVITAAMAIEEGKANLNSHYNCNGSIVIAGNRYHCHKREGHGSENFTNAMQNSCNPVFITLGQQLGSNTFSKYFEAFGFTQKTGIDLPGESSPVYHKSSAMGPTELASSSFGQTFNVTPIQMITAISAAVNGGYLVQPHLVSEIVDVNGNTVKTVDTSPKRQVISEETSKTLRGMMEAVVDGGGGKNAYVSGYRIGGKTGTSEKTAQGIEAEKKLYIASFCGVAPIDDPEIAVLVILDEPHGDAYYGGTIAAPVGGQILSEILPYLGVNPQYSDEELSQMDVKVPNVVNMSLSEAKSKIKQQGLSYRVEGNGDTVVKQFPTASDSIQSDGVVILYTESSADVDMVTVPDFTGLTVDGVNELAADSKINVSFSGASQLASGAISYKQSIPKDTEVAVGTVVTVYFRTIEAEG